MSALSHNPRKRRADIEISSGTLAQPAKRSRMGLSTATCADQKAELCGRCANIDFDLLVKQNSPAVYVEPKTNDLGRVLDRPWEFVSNLGPLTSWNTKSCPLCRLFEASMKRSETHLALVEHGETYLYLHKTRKLPSRTWTPFETITLELLDHRCDTRPHYVSPPTIVLQQEQDFPVRIIRPLVDVDILEGWINFCDMNHSGACATGCTSSTTLLPESFRLIDCKTREIVSGSSKRYAALSYVWGDDSPTQLQITRVPHSQPATIEDAMALTRNLKIRFLWIDRYCIDQIDHSDVHDQVSKMHAIYLKAHVTIVAAAGTDPSFGLSGINSRTRSPQPHTRIGENLLISPLSDLAEELRDSTWNRTSSGWNRRAWTFQESMLSRRLLVFTENQVYFECAGMTYREAIDLPLEELHTSDPFQPMNPYLESGCALPSLSKFHCGNGSTIISQILGEYIRRYLSKPSDILNGALGILGACEHLYGIRHCCGVPIFRFFLDSSSCSSLLGFIMGLSSCHLSPPAARTSVSKRSGFPSWSWTGWTWPEHSDLSFPLPITDDNYTIHISVRLELHQGRIVSWDEFEQQYDEVKNQLSSILHITAPLYPLDATSLRIRFFTLGYSMNAECTIHYHPSSQDTLLLSRCFGMLMCTQVNDIKSIMRFMVISEVEEGIYERIGYAWCDKARFDIDGDAEKLTRTFRLR